MDSDCSSQDSVMTPRTRKRLNFLLKAVGSREARLGEDSQGRVQIYYNDDGKNPLHYVSTSKAHTIQEGKDPEDVQRRVDACVKLLKATKAVVFDPSKVTVSSQGTYQEGKDFENLNEVLGSGCCAGDIMVVKDNITGAKHAVKAMMISQFFENEVRAWVDLGESDTFPSLYLFRREGNAIFCHMEIIEHGVTLDDVIAEHMSNMRERQPEMVKPFSLCMFHGLLSAVNEMHEKKWAHNDLHGKNVMLTKDTMKIKILDFGWASELDANSMKKDILSALMLFVAMYTGQTYHGIIQGKLNETLKRMLTTSPLSQEDKVELMQLISMTFEVTSNPRQAGYGDTAEIRERVQYSVGGTQENMAEVLRTVAVVLFPDLYKEDKDMHAQEQMDVDSRSESDSDVDMECNNISREFLGRVSIRKQK